VVCDYGVVSRVALAYHAGLPISVEFNVPLYYARHNVTLKEIIRRCPDIRVDLERKSDRTMAHFSRPPGT
jgi:hypothetical protein